MPVGRIRPARPGDVPEIHALIRELAAYERAEHEVVSTPETLHASLFGGTDAGGGAPPTTHHGAPAAFCHVVEHAHDHGALGGIALWFLNYSTWLGQHGIYLEDLYVRPQLRGLGYGTGLLATLADVAVRHGYGRVEWWVLDWNEPALAFYRGIGAEPMDEWTVQRLTGPALTALAAHAPGDPAGP